VAGTSKILDFIGREISGNSYVNVMDQYRPCGNVHEDEYIGQRLTSKEFNDAVEAARNAGLKRLDPRERVRIIFGL
jgi:putative pyruvate formate lyase activating enzyme